MYIYLYSNFGRILCVCVCEEISPVLTSADPPVFFAEEDRPQANIRTHPPPLYMGHRHSVACQAVRRYALGIQSCEPQAPAAERAHPTTCATGPAPRIDIFMILSLTIQSFYIFLSCQIVFLLHPRAYFISFNKIL